MAEPTPEKAPRKTPARKTATRKGPTQAAALKALGLTKEDLAALKELRTQQASTPEPAPACTCNPGEACSDCPPKVVEAAANLRPGSGLVNPNASDPQAEIEYRQAPVPQQPNIPQTAEEPTWYMRNLRYMEVGFRLSRQSDSTKKRTQLKPRGQRGDIVKLEPGDLKDSELQTQVAFGVVEIISEGEARQAIAKQNTNRQQAVPSHIAMLRNEKGEEYTQSNPVRMASDEEAFGIKVADLNPDLMSGRMSDKEIKRDGGFAQQNLVGEVQNPSPGRIVSDGFIDPVQTDSSQLGNNDQRSQEIDALARSKAFEGPGAGLGEVTVKVAPVQRT
jgi:hypothetical protein